MTFFIVLNLGFPAQRGEARRSRRTQHGRHGSKHDAERASIGRILLGRISEKFVEAKFSDSFKAEFGSAPVRGTWISPVVASLRVATPCYATGQRTLLGRLVSTPKRYHHAALGRLRLS